MKILRLTLFSFEIFCLEIGEEGEEHDDDILLTKDAVERMVDRIQGKKMGGGQLLETDRDLSPLIPGTEKDYDSYVDRPFGFHKGNP